MDLTWCWQQVYLPQGFSHVLKWTLLKLHLLLYRFQSEYEVIQRLGKGSFGCVYKARQKLVKKNFAIKIVTWKE